MKTRERVFRWLSHLLALPALVGGVALAQQQGQAGQMGDMGRMMPGGMWLGIVLTVLLTVATIVALVALAIFLIRRSRPGQRTT